MSFLKRLLSTLILVPIAIWVLYQGGAVFIGFVTLLMAVALYEFWNISRHEVKKRWRLSVLAFGIIYTIIALYAMISLRNDYGFVFAGLIMLGVWSSDIGGYIFGKLIGGRKLCPTISPNKTWAGLIGACLFPYFILDGYLAFFATNLNAREMVYWGLGASLVIGLLGQAGDMLISLLKRRVGLKDTGHLIPGHGGVLDRIDAMMLVMIVVWGLLSLKIIVWNLNIIPF